LPSCGVWVPACAGDDHRKNQRGREKLLRLERGPQRARAVLRCGVRPPARSARRPASPVSGSTSSLSFSASARNSLSFMVASKARRRRVDALGRHARRQEVRPAIFEPREQKQERLPLGVGPWRDRAPTARRGDRDVCGSAHCARILIFFSAIQCGLSERTVVQLVAALPWISPLSIARWILGRAPRSR